MAIRTTCPNPDCRKAFRLEEKAPGRRARCKACNTRFRVRVGEGEPLSAGGSVSASAASAGAPAAEDQGSAAGRTFADADQVPAEWNVGDVILDLYEVTGLLGQGGMGKVYKVRHKEWNVDLAVKSPLATLLESRRAIENFIAECQTSGQCLRTFEGHTHRVYSVALSGDGRYALSGSLDNALKLWELVSGQ